ncbi:hypothetical protein Poli38472_006746 [Pythium oligandrum]|uniref:Uncharacterized protein n=1 Tax=Pythium oligandrum TaxID=41045 RepID=A0A8K1C553_PYTOL|nr:hypothetical protein Poli38472_006746 [Pythium oligandrum]|eukprot:TMW56736.1 hypothetical protein Poli38472_006746 [Pythium oligandrum]
MTAATTGIQSPVSSRLGSQTVVSVIPAKHTLTLFCSGMMHSRVVEHWTLENVFGTSEERFDKWYWFMYAMFHVSATHSIKSLEIREEDFPIKDIEQVAHIVHGSPSVLHEIYSPFLEPLNFTEYNTEMFDYEGPPRMGSSITLKTGATIHLEMVQRGSMHVTVAQGHTPFQVIYPRYDMVAILVPAYGKCWVNKSDIVAEIPNLYIDSVIEEQWKLKTHQITQLSFRFSGEPDLQSHGAVELLKLIGMPLKSLAIEFPRHDIWRVWSFNDVWESCPHLVELCMENLGTTSLDIFVDAYASGKCRVSSLELFECALKYKRSVLSFSKALGDPSSPLAKTLQQLRFRLEEEDGIIVTSDDEDEEGLDDCEVVLAFLSALKTNQKLVFFELHVKSRLYEDYKEAFERLNSQYLSIVRRPLPVRAKCAFLSVVKKAQTEENVFSIKGLASLDTHVLRHIFHMASEPEKRTIILDERSKMTGTPTFETRHLREGETRYGFGYPRTEELDE